ncbi:MAG: hypothetical protein FJ088_06790 [Deltaproteobacteria bacterium]|nr:hypothetical protein [Deltaproteobacteria bacterium]
MTHLRAGFILIFACFLITVSLDGCRKVKTKIGLGELVEYPNEGTPEKVIQEVLKSAAMPEEEGWQKFTTLLHSEEKLPTLLNNWRQFSYREIRKKADYFIKDKAMFSFKIKDEKSEGESLKIYIENSMSDVPTPCTLRKDKSEGDAWKVFGSCL